MPKKARNNTTRPASNMEPPVSDAALRAHEIPAFNAPVRICIASVRGRLADPDGISAKAAIDGLVACGILPTDTTEQVEQVTFTQRKGKRETTTIIIESGETPKATNQLF
jgi:hypothetical protein